MIKVTALNCDHTFYVNDEHIDLIEETPDTIITLQSGKKVYVAELPEELVAQIRKVRRLRYARAEGGNVNL